MSDHSFQDDLLSWYRSFGRDLPWRRTRDSYQIWISEVMCQQTRVETVIPYYEKFISSFPDVHSLSSANSDEVLKHWEGLGYYRRAHHLMDCAKQIVDGYEGKLPETSNELLKLKGFGPYTSAAVASIAFGEPVAAIDGNVKRVVSRLFASGELIEENAQSLMAPSDPSSFNQAMMELGARVCTPRSPKCMSCPVQFHCKAFQLEVVDQYPKPKKRIKPKNLYCYVLIHTDPNITFVEQRGSEGRWANLWQFPSIESPQMLNTKEQVKAWEKQYGFTFEKLEHLGSFLHQLSHQSIHVDVFRASFSKPTALKNGKLIKIATLELPEFAFSRLQQKAQALAFGS